MAQPKLNQRKLNSIMVPFPEIEDQQKIVEIITDLMMKTKKAKQAYKAKLTALDELKKSLLQKAFNGELTAAEGLSA